jgi:MFS transporter, DHA1 family, tetracycline resistance protein
MRRLSLLIVIIALVFAAIGFSTPLVTLYLQGLGADYGQIALILATTAAVGLLSSYLWGRASDLLGRRKPLIVVGLAGLAGAYFLLSRVTSPTGAWAIRLGEAAFAAAYNTASLALVGDLLAGEGRRGQRMGIYRGIGSFAFAIGAFLGGRFADAFSLRLVFVAAASLYVAAALVSLTIREAPRPRQDAAPVSQPDAGGRPPRRSFRPSLPLLFLGGVFLWMMTWNGQASMWPNYMASLGYDKTSISSLWGLAGLIEFPAMWLAGMWSDTVGRAVLLAASGVGAVAVMLGYVVFSRVLPALAGVQVLRGFTFGAYTANAMTFAVESGDERMRGSNSGLLNTVGGMGQLAGLLLGGTLAQAGGFTFMFGVFAVTALLSAACFFMLRRRSARIAEPSAQAAGNR